MTFLTFIRNNLTGYFILANKTPNNCNYLTSGYEYCGLLWFRGLIGGSPLNVDWVSVQLVNPMNTTYGCSEAVQALMEAWLVHHTCEADGNI